MGRLRVAAEVGLRLLQCRGPVLCTSQPAVRKEVCVLADPVGHAADQTLVCGFAAAWQRKQRS